MIEEKGRGGFIRTAQKIMDITFEGKRYSLEYDGSIIESAWAHLDNIDIYSYFDPRLDLLSLYTTQIEVDSETEEVLYFDQRLGANYIEDNLAAGKSVCEREQCQAIAEKFIKETLGEDLGYKLVNTYLEYQKVYYFTFSREVVGIDRYEPVTVKVGIFGELLGYDFKRVGEMSGAESLSEEDLAEIEKSVEKKLRERLESEKPGYTDDPEFKVEISRSEIYRFTDGRSVIKYTVKYERPPFPEQSIAETQKGSMTFYACLD